MTSKLDIWIKFQYRAIQFLNLKWMSMPSRIRQADVLDACFQVGFDNLENFRGVDGPLETASECRLNRSLNPVSFCERLPSHCDDLPESIRRRHPRIFAAVCVAGGNTHAKQVYATSQSAFQSFLVQNQSGEGDTSRFFPGEVAKQGIRFGHLWHLPRVDERSQLDEVNARGEQILDPTDLLFQRDD